MFKYVQITKEHPWPQVLCIAHNQKAYSPMILHTALNQDRPFGEKSTFKEHSHDLYHLNLYSKGGGYTLEGKTYETTEDSLVIISPGQKHDLVTNRGDCVYSEITFSMENKNGDSMALPFNKILSIYTGVDVELGHQLKLSKEASKAIYMAIVDITDYLETVRPLSMFYVQLRMAKIFESIVTHSATCFEAEQKVNGDQRAVHVKDYIEKHYNEQITTEQLAKQCCVSKGYLFRIFKEVYGVTPVSYQQALRLQAAQVLLRSTDLNCNEISHRVGYGNVYFFHRLFKKKFNITPKQYRNRIRNDIGSPAKQPNKQILSSANTM